MRINHAPEITVSLQNGKSYTMDITEFCDRTKIQYLTLRNALKRGVMPKSCRAFGITEIRYQDFHVTQQYFNPFNGYED